MIEQKTKPVILPVVVMNDNDIDKMGLSTQEENSLIEQIVNEGWELGMTINGQNEFWPPD